MLIAHAPASYLLTKTLEPYLERSRALLPLGMLTGIAPDFDLLYFYFIDNRQHNHHTYWTHVPFYLALAVVLLACIEYKRYSSLALSTVFAANLLLHLLLDSLCGGICWAAPWSYSYYWLITVPPRFGPSMWNFVFHWSFLIEIALVLGVWRYRKKSLVKRNLMAP